MGRDFRWAARWFASGQGLYGEAGPGRLALALVPLTGDDRTRAATAIVGYLFKVGGDNVAWIRADLHEARDLAEEIVRRRCPRAFDETVGNGPERPAERPDGRSARLPGRLSRAVPLARPRRPVGQVQPMGGTDVIVPGGVMIALADGQGDPNSPAQISSADPSCS